MKQGRDEKGKFLPKHGLHDPRVRERYSDLRTREGRRLKAILDAISDDLGGQEALNGGQRLLLDTLQSKLIVILRISDFVDRQPKIITDEGELLPVLGKSYLAYLNSVRLVLADLYKHWDGPKPVKTLEQYLSEAKEESKDGQ